jgi:ribonucleoside-diphosphate reductase beta chain
MRGLMGDTSDMIRKINEDEYTHIVIFQKLVTEGMKVFPHSKDQIYEMFSKASEHEILWNNHITNDNIL